MYQKYCCIIQNKSSVWLIGLGGVFFVFWFSFKRAQRVLRRSLETKFFKGIVKSYAIVSYIWFWFFLEYLSDDDDDLVGWLWSVSGTDIILKHLLVFMTCHCPCFVVWRGISSWSVDYQASHLLLLWQNFFICCSWLQTSTECQFETFSSSLKRFPTLILS